jgi:hypothetical protein
MPTTFATTLVKPLAMSGRQNEKAKAFFWGQKTTV